MSLILSSIFCLLLPICPCLSSSSSKLRRNLPCQRERVCESKPHLFAGPNRIFWGELAFISFVLWCK